MRKSRSRTLAKSVVGVTIPEKLTAEVVLLAIEGSSLL